MSESYVIGIDLGTTYSCVAVMIDGRVEIIANDHGHRITPSYVAFNEKERLVGDAALQQAAQNPTNTLFDAKRLIGRGFDDEVVQNDMEYWPFKVIDRNGKPKLGVNVNGKLEEFYPEEISAMILERMKAIAENYLGTEIKKAVITVPAYFNNSQRQATIDAGKIAGLEVLRVINEPTAAALAYGLNKKADPEQNVLIFDLGGGTFDVSILSICEGLFKVLATGGDTHLGGEDFDNRLVRHCCEEFKKSSNIKLTDARALRQLKTACEKAKRTLSFSSQASIEIDSLFQGLDFKTKISRARFEELNADFFKITIDLLQKTLKDAKMDKEEIDEVVLVGGSTRIPKMKTLLQNFFNGKTLNESIHPDEAVAFGAAVQAAILSGDICEDVQGICLLDVTPLTLGITTGKEHVMGVIVPRNTTIPVSRTERYTTVRDNQPAVEIIVLEGERVKEEDNYILGEFSLSGIPPAPRGKPQVDVTFDLDENGIFHVTAIDVSTQNKHEITIDNKKGRLSDDEISRMIASAETHKDQDRKTKAAVRAKSNLDLYCYNLRETLQSEQFQNNLRGHDERRLCILAVCKEIEKMLLEDLKTAQEYENHHEYLIDCFQRYLTEPPNAIQEMEEVD